MPLAFLGRRRDADHRVTEKSFNPLLPMLKWWVVIDLRRHVQWLAKIRVSDLALICCQLQPMQWKAMVNKWSLNPTLPLFEQRVVVVLRRHLQWLARIKLRPSANLLPADASAMKSNGQQMELQPTVTSIWATDCRRSTQACDMTSEDQSQT